MNVSIRRIKAIFIKDYKEFSRNYAVFIVFIFPIIMAILYGRSGNVSTPEIYLLMNMTFAMVGTYVQSCLIAEERDKDTLKGLLLSPASTLDIMLGKSLLTFIVTGIALLLVGFITSYHPAHMSLIMLACILSLIFYILLGSLIGLFAKSIMDASVYSFPVIGLATIGSFTPLLIENYPFLTFIRYLPSSLIMDIAVKVDNGSGFVSVSSELLWISLWCVGMIILTILFYKKRYVE